MPALPTSLQLLSPVFLSKQGTENKSTSLAAHSLGFCGPNNPFLELGFSIYNPGKGNFPFFLEIIFCGLQLSS